MFAKLSEESWAGMKLRWLNLVMMLGGVAAWGQASALPSAQTNASPLSVSADNAVDPNKGRKLLDQMVAALGGDAWLHRQDFTFSGRSATFYKGQPHEEVPQFEEYYRMRPFGERIILISHYGIFIATDHKDIAEVFTPDNGYEVTYKGKTPLPAKDVQDFLRRRSHSIETVVDEWMKQPGVLVTYEGTNMVERRLAEQISILTATNDAVTLELDERTHLPLSLSFQWRDPLYKDFNTDVEEYEDYHAVQGIQTPYAITRLHNGDMVLQRFLTKVVYNSNLSPDLFDPDRPLEKKAK
jgi:hypothetical protein